MSGNPPAAANVIPIGRRRSTTRDGWEELVRAPESQTPPRHSTKAIAKMPDGVRARYARVRVKHHMNLPAIATSAIRSTLDHVMPLLDGNEQIDRRAAPQSVAISGDPHVGKTVLIEAIGRRYELARRKLHPWGTRMETGGLYVPIVMIDLAERTRPVDLDKKILRFLHAPVGGRATQGEIAEAVLDHLESCGTSVVIIDDIHELRMSRENGQQVNAKIKHIADQAGVTFVVAGVDLAAAQFLTEGKGQSKHASAQTRRRFTLFNLEPYEIGTPQGREDWVSLLAAIERELVLANGTGGALTSHWELLFNRSQGYIGTITGLARQAANAAIANGSERLTEKLLRGTPVNLAGTVEEAAETKKTVGLRRVRTSE